MRLSAWWLGVASLAALLLTSLARAESAATTERVRVRAGPGTTNAVVGDLPPGTKVDLLGESSGWRQVRTRDGLTGWVLAERVTTRQPEPTLAEPARRPDASSGPPRTLADEVRDLHDELSALRERPQPATAADVERVRLELERLATAERDLARRFDDRFAAAPPGADPSPDGVLGFGPVLLALGGAIGFVASRLLQRRRDRWQRNRLRL